MVHLRIHRRCLLITVGTSVIGLTGCIDEETPEVGLGRIHLFNYRANAEGLNVRVEKGGEEVYDELHSLEGAGNNTVDGDEIAERWMGDTVQYEVTFELEEGDLTETYSTADAEQFVDDWGDADCFELYVTIEEDRLTVGLHGQDSCPNET